MSDILERLDYTRDALDSMDNSTPHPVDTTTRDGWSVTDLDTAAWASRKAAQAHRAIAEIDAWEQRQIELVRAAATTERGREQNTLQFFEGALAQYLAQLIRDGRKTKTLTLPHGRIAIRSRPPQLDLDEPRAIAWAREHAPELVRVKESIDKAALKKTAHLTEGGQVITNDGEVLDFVTWSDPGDAGKFTPADDKEAEHEE